jgi:hypothetical protein
MILSALALGCAPVQGAPPITTVLVPMDTPAVISPTEMPQNALSETTSVSAANVTPAQGTERGSCPLTESVWFKPPEDSAVNDPPAFGYYYVNKDESIIASAWWTDEKYADSLRAGENGVKVGWFRPAGADLVITGERLDREAPPLESHVPCCYPTRFQATGIIFPTEGCWHVTARAAQSELKFVVWVQP